MAVVTSYADSFRPDERARMWSRVRAGTSPADTYCFETSWVQTLPGAPAGCCALLRRRITVLVIRRPQALGDLVRMPPLDLVALEHVDHLAVLEEGYGR